MRCFLVVMCTVMEEKRSRAPLVEVKTLRPTRQPIAGGETAGTQTATDLQDFHDDTKSQSRNDNHQDERRSLNSFYFTSRITERKKSIFFFKNPITFL